MADLLLLFFLTQSELQNTFYAKDFKYPKATESNCYNPWIIFHQIQIYILSTIYTSQF